jgi:hypothetical protein
MERVQNPYFKMAAAKVIRDNVISVMFYGM